MFKYEKFYIRILKQKLEEKMMKNPSYSLRAFAKFLSINPGNMSHILSGERKISIDRIDQISSLLKLSLEEHDFFRNSVLLSHESINNYDHQRKQERVEISIDNKELLEDPFFSLILTLSKSKNSDRSLINFHKLLKIEEKDLLKYLDTLIQLGLIKKEDNQYKSTMCGFVNRHRLKDNSINHFFDFHISNIVKAEKELTFNEKVFHSGMINISKNNIERYRVVFDDFMGILKNMSDELDTNSADTICGISLFLYPLLNIKSDVCKSNIAID